MYIPPHIAHGFNITQFVQHTAVSIEISRKNVSTAYGIVTTQIEATTFTSKKRAAWPRYRT